MNSIAYDPAKRDNTLLRRGLDFEDAAIVFAGRYLTAPDERRNYGESRFISVGSLRRRTVVIVWTPRAGARRVISMRYAHDKEAREWRNSLG